MAGDGTGRLPNPACDALTYNGGTHCCKHSWFLTDRGQDSLIPADTDMYYLKWRYYFQEYVPATQSSPATHIHLHHWVFLIDQVQRERERERERSREREREEQREKERRERDL
jgi:hypothetical protein